MMRSHACINHQSSTINHQPSIINHHRPTPKHHPPHPVLKHHHPNPSLLSLVSLLPLQGGKSPFCPRGKQPSRPRSRNSSIPPDTAIGGDHDTKRDKLLERGASNPLNYNLTWYNPFSLLPTPLPLPSIKGNGIDGKGEKLKL